MNTPPNISSGPLGVIDIPSQWLRLECDDGEFVLVKKDAITIIGHADAFSGKPHRYIGILGSLGQAVSVSPYNDEELAKVVGVPCP